MNAFDRLQAAYAEARQGNHEHALQEYIWFHHNALAEIPSLDGVRLSFALLFWVQLGEVYPPALRALEKIRDDGADRLRRGAGNGSTFSDVASINGYLAATRQTYALFVHLSEAQPELAMECARKALPAIVEAGDFRLALQFMPDPDARLPGLVKSLNRDVRMLKHRPLSHAPERWSYIRNFGEELARMLSILNENGMRAEANRVRALALGLIESPSVRRAVSAEIIRPAKFAIPRSLR